MSVKDGVVKVKKTLEELTGEVRGTAEAVRETIDMVRPRPIRRIVRKRLARVMPNRFRKEQ